MSFLRSNNNMDVIRHNRPLVEIVPLAIVVLKHTRNGISNQRLSQRTASES